MKKCSKCEEVKSFEEFYRSKAKKDGLQSNCKSCWKAYHEANKEKLNAKSKAYREANKDKISTKRKAYREANRDKIKARNKAYKEANKNKVKARMRTYRESNKDKIKDYRESNKDKAKAYREAKRNERIEQLKQIIEPNTDGKWIYIMECGIYHKIGISNDPLRRVEEIEDRTQAPTHIIYLAKANYGRTIDTEQIIHHELNCFNVPMPYINGKHENHVSKEWFYGSIDKMVEIVGQYAKLEDMQEVAV